LNNLLVKLYLACKGRRKEIMALLAPLIKFFLGQCIFLLIVFYFFLLPLQAKEILQINVLEGNIEFERESLVVDEDTVILQGLDKITARVFTIEARLGEVIAFGNLRIIPHSCQKSSPEDLPESTIYLDILEVTPGSQPKKIFSGWMFASSPSSSALEHPVYDVWVKECRPRSMMFLPEDRELEGDVKVQDLKEDSEMHKLAVDPKFTY
jgi:hypothetical protein